MIINYMVYCLSFHNLIRSSFCNTLDWVIVVIRSMSASGWCSSAVFVGRVSRASCKGPATSGFNWSVHRMGELSRSLVSSTLPFTRKDALWCKIPFRDVIEEFQSRQTLLVADMEEFERNSVHNTLRYFFSRANKIPKL